MPLPALDLTVIPITKSASGSVLVAVFDISDEPTWVHFDKITTSRAVAMWRHPTERAWSAYKFSQEYEVVPAQDSMYYPRNDVPWDEERVLDRFELLYEAGLVEEARRDGRRNAEIWQPFPVLGRPMRFDHRRILATAISRLRAKLKYRPVIFELMPRAFTLTQLQHTVEAISGRHLHKQNFRRLVEQGKLVEPTGEPEKSTGGRPAALFRFRREVLAERPAPGLRLGGRG